MAKGFTTALKVIGVIMGILIGIIGLFVMIAVPVSMGSYSYYDTAGSSIVFIFLGLYIIIEAFVTFAVLFFMGSAGDYMRLKLQKSGLWGVKDLVPVQNVYYGYQQQPAVQPQAQPQEQPAVQQAPDPDAIQSEDQENTVS